MLRSNTSPRPARRGNILLVTLAMLSLMAVVGLAAVYYAKDQAERARIAGQPGPDLTMPDDGMPELNAFLASLIYDVPDDHTAAGNGRVLYNAVRGHSLMATMYGRATGATVAWNGPGTFSATSAIGLDRRQLVNHQFFLGMTTVVDPEYNGDRALLPPAGSPPGTPPPAFAYNGVAYRKNPPYTYPDLKDLYLAAICPATGEVLVPSFYRDWLFRDQTPPPAGRPATESPLSPNNPNWKNPQGKYLILRPRPQEHPNFPPVPLNADGVTYTGDVKNLVGAPGGNDSIWIDIGAPVLTLPNGKRVKALIAPLILDLDGRLNLSAHGNLTREVPPAAPATSVFPTNYVFASGAGIGPWEVNLEKLLGAEGSAIVALRGAPQTRAGSNSRAYARYPTDTQLPQYAQVPWAGFTSAASAANPPLQLPGFGGLNLFSNSPFYTNGYDGRNAALALHTSLYNPNEWPTSAGTTALRTFPLGDTKILAGRYAPYPYNSGMLTFAGQAPGTLKGTYALPNPNPPLATTQNAYRTDPAHRNRMSFTTRSNALDRTGLMPGALNAQFDTYAGIGPLDLNRRLADYRGNTAAELSPTNMGNQVVADYDRQQFATDIFARLIVATGATGATVDPTTWTLTITSTPSDPETPEYQNLRKLAQVAANLVDYVDPDDINFAFVWNPLPSPNPGVPADPRAATNFVPGVAGAPLGALEQRVVFGVEKPRLVINEAYSEMVNDPTDTATGGKKQPPTGPANIRFWLELLNPTAAPYVDPTAGLGTRPLGTGAAPLWHAAGFSPYRVEIAQGQLANGTANPNAVDYLSHPANVTGGFKPGFDPQIVFLFNSADIVGNAAKQQVAPNNGVYDAGGNPASGIALVGPMVSDPNATPPVTAKPDEFDLWALNNRMLKADPPLNQNPRQNSMTYQTALPAAAAVNRPDFKRHVVLLRRLANPYMLESPTNPPVTHDLMDYVPSFDGVHRASDDMTGTGRGGGGMKGGYTPPAQRYAIGKVQPLAGLTVRAGTDTENNPTFAFPASMVLAQKTVQGNNPKNTFGRHNGVDSNGAYVLPPTMLNMGQSYPLPSNGAETIMAPFEWLVHMDRPLVNQVEALHVTAGKPHELTQQFIVPNTAPMATTSTVAHGGSIQTALLSNNFPQLYRALDLLRVQQAGQLAALGGRVPGRVNLNTIQDKRVWDALFDAQGGNGFTQQFVDQLWLDLIGSRTRNLTSRTDATGVTTTNTHSCPVPGPSVYDTGSASDDRPFLPFGVSPVAAGGVTVSPPAPATTPPPTTVLGGGTSLNDTIFRLRPLPPPPPPPAVPPPPPAPIDMPYISVTSGTHPYQKMEAARKILNNTTTVSHTFVAIVTVGYFEVEAETPTGIPNVADFVTLGKEYYRAVPGDSRHKFIAFLDRSIVGLQPAVDAHSTERPFFTTVEQTAAKGATSLTIAPSRYVAADMTQVPPIQQALFVTSEGEEVQIVAGMTLVIGTGASQQVVSVTGIDPASPTVLVSALTRNAYVGDVVSNVRPGNPGPQTSFDVTSTMYKPVVPHWSRLP